MPAIASGGVVKTYGAVGGASSLATTITGNANNALKGTAVELTAATTYDAHWMLVAITDMSQTGGTYFVDILAGAATEAVIVPDLFAAPRAPGAASGPYLFPVFVPKGTRIAARCQASGGASTARVAVTLVSGGPSLPGAPPPSGAVSAYGATASVIGTNVDPGGVADTDSAWTEIAAATNRDHHWIVISGRFGDGSLAATTHWRLSVGIGSATEADLIPALHFSADTASDFPFNPVVCLPCFVPKGSRLAVLVRSSVTTDADRDINVKLYGAG